MKYLVALLLIALGGFLIYAGCRRARSVSGIAGQTGREIANAFDGKLRVGQHVYYYAGGGALVLAGAATLLIRRKKD
jgi:hypothetical protein